MIKKLFGTSPLSSLLGYVLSGLMVYQETTSAGEADKSKIAIAILIAVLGRIVKDSNGIPAAQEKKQADTVVHDNTNDKI